MTTEKTVEHRWAALIALCAGMLMIVLDETIVNVALPAIQKDLHFSQAGLSWVVNAYLVAFGGTLLLAGRLGDIIGRRKMFLTGLVAFIASSMLCGISTSQSMLIATRLLQGVGGAMTSAVILGMIINSFPEAKEQAKAMGIFMFIATGGASIGLLAGGIITQAINWHWIFFVNFPIGIVVFISASRYVKPDEGIGWDNGADIPGAVLITSGLMLAVYSIIKATDYGWISVHTFGLGAIALALIAAFIKWESYTSHPLLPLRVFKSRNIAIGNFLQVLTVVGMFGMFFLGALYFQKVLNYSSLKIGFAFLPDASIMGLVSLFVTPLLSARLGSKRTTALGFAICSFALILFARLPNHSTYIADILPSLVILGIGAGFAFPCLATIAMSDANETDSGLVSGMFNTSAQLGGALGLAVLATLSTSRTNALLAKGVASSPALVSGYRIAFGVGAALMVAAFMVTAVVLKESSNDLVDETVTMHDKVPVLNEVH